MKMSIIVMFISLLFTISENFNAKILMLKTKKLAIFDKN